MNPMMMLMQAMQGGGNPLAFIQQHAASNPKFQQLQQIVGGKNPQELRQIADNMLRQRGSSIEQAEQMYSQQMGQVNAPMGYTRQGKA